MSTSEVTKNSEEQPSKGMLAQEVDRVLIERNWSLAAAEIATGVGRGTIHNMRKGVRVSPEKVYTFAKRIAKKGQEEETLRRFASLYEQDRKASENVWFHAFDVRANEQLPTESQEVERTPDPDFVPDPDEITIYAEGFSGLDEVEKAQIALATEAAARAMVESLRASRAATATGGGMSPDEKRQWQAKKDASRERLRKRIVDESDDPNS